jgi:hypothetical protein
MARAPSFNFGANVQSKKAAAKKGGKKKKAGKKVGRKGKAWTGYTGG